MLNLTPHTLNIYNNVGIETIIPRTEVSEGRYLVLRVVSTSTTVDIIDSFTVSRTVYGNIKLVTVDEHGKNELPFEGVLPTADYYIVSMLCLNTFSNMHADNGSGFVPLLQHGQFELKKLLAPGELLRDNLGKPIGCKGFSRL